MSNLKTNAILVIFSEFQYIFIYVAYRIPIREILEVAKLCFSLSYFVTQIFRNRDFYNYLIKINIKWFVRNKNFKILIALNFPIRTFWSIDIFKSIWNFIIFVLYLFTYILFKIGKKRGTTLNWCFWNM